MRKMAPREAIFTCIHVREDTLVCDLLKRTQVSVRALLHLGAQNDEIRQVLVKPDRDSVLGVVDEGVQSGAARSRSLSLTLGGGFVLQRLRVGNLRLQVCLCRLHCKVARARGVSGTDSVIIMGFFFFLPTYIVHSTLRRGHPCPL